MIAAPASPHPCRETETTDIINNRLRQTLSDNGIDLNQFLTGSGGLATGAAAGGLAAILLGGAKPKKLMKNGAKLGGAALIGGLAYKAWRNWEERQGATAPAAPDQRRFLPAPDAEGERLARAMTMAMIAAAKADGHIDADERARIESQLDAVGLDRQAADFVRQQLAAPADVNAIAAEATTPEIAADLYAASLLAIDPDGIAEKAWLGLLAARLDLAEPLVAEIHDTVEREYRAA